MPTYVKFDERGRRFTAYPMSQSVGSKSASGRAKTNLVFDKDRERATAEARALNACVKWAAPTGESTVVRPPQSEPKVRRERMPPPRDRVKGNRYVAWRA